jgi:hypothetical protein
MIGTKSVSALTYEDIRSLTLAGENESVMLDYKKSIAATEREKGEIAKDISAFANSQGGYLIIGVEEKDGKPVDPPCGTDRMLGRQKVEEWIGQVANSNIAQRVPMDMKVLAMPESDTKCVIAIHVPMSIRMPHMVTFERDNRYYRRIFKRHQFESLPAEEYEVREMFDKGSRIADRTNAYLSSQGYLDVISSQFAQNNYTRLLGMRVTNRTELEIVPATHFVSFVAFPDLLADGQIDTSKEDLWAWLEPNARRYAPDVRNLFLPLEKRTTLDGVLLTEDEYRANDEQPRFLRKFLRINRNGYIELGCNLASQREADVSFAFVPMIGLFWQFIGFVADLYKLEALFVPFKIMLNMKCTDGTLLHNLADGWLEPFESLRAYRPLCVENNIQIFEQAQGPSLDGQAIEDIVRRVALRVDNAWGQREARCFNHSSRDARKQLPVGRMRY